MLWLVEFSFLKNYWKTSGVKRLKVSRALLSQSSAAGLGVIDGSDWSWCNGGSKGQDCAPVLVRRRTEFITFQIPIYYALCLQQFICTLLKKKIEQHLTVYFPSPPSHATSWIICTLFCWRQKWKVYCLQLLPSLLFKTKYWVWLFLT